MSGDLPVRCTLGGCLGNNTCAPGYDARRGFTALGSIGESAGGGGWARLVVERAQG